MKIIKLTDEMQEFYTEELNDVKRKIIDCLESIDEGEIDLMQNSFIRNLLENV